MRDFLLKEHRGELRIKAGADFDARFSLCQMKLLQLKRAEQDYDGSFHRLHVMELLHYGNLIEQEPFKIEDPQALIGLLHELNRVMKHHSRLYRVFRNWNRLALGKSKKWPDLSWIAASAGLTHFMKQDIEINHDTAHLSVLLLCSLGYADLGVESTAGDNAMPVFARNINTIRLRLLLTTKVDPNYSTNTSITPWVSFLRHLYRGWTTFNAQSKQIALDIVCELVQRGAHVRVQDEEDHLGSISVFNFVRNQLGEPTTAWRLKDIVKTRQKGERANGESHLRRSESLEPPITRQPKGRFAGLLEWTKW